MSVLDLVHVTYLRGDILRMSRELVNHLSVSNFADSTWFRPKEWYGSDGYGGATGVYYVKAPIMLLDIGCDENRRWLAEANITTMSAADQYMEYRGENNIIFHDCLMESPWLYDFDGTIINKSGNEEVVLFRRAYHKITLLSVTCAPKLLGL